MKDGHLQSYFINGNKRKHLEKMNLITKQGYIVEKPEEYKRNKDLLRNHYKSSSPKKKGKKGTKAKRESKNNEEGNTKEDHEKFMDQVKNSYGLDKEAEAGKEVEC